MYMYLYWDTVGYVDVVCMYCTVHMCYACPFLTTQLLFVLVFRCQ